MLGMHLRLLFCGGGGVCEVDVRVASVRDVVAWVYARVAVGGTGLGQERTSEDRRLWCAWDPQRGPGSCHASQRVELSCGASDRM